MSITLRSACYNAINSSKKTLDIDELPADLQKEVQALTSSLKSETPLTSAITFDEPNVVNYFLYHSTVDGKYHPNNQRIKNINLREYKDLSPLHLAVIRGNKALIEEFLKEGSDINERDKESGNTPLHFAVLFEFDDIAQFLINQKANVNKTNRNRETPLHVAALYDREEACKILLQNNAQINAETFPRPKTPLDMAAFNNSMKVAKLLVEHDADMHKSLFYAVKAKNIDMLEFLLTSGKHFNAHQLDEAFQHGPYSKQALELLLKHGANPDPEWEEPHWAYLRPISLNNYVNYYANADLYLTSDVTINYFLKSFSKGCSKEIPESIKLLFSPITHIGEKIIHKLHLKKPLAIGLILTAVIMINPSYIYHEIKFSSFPPIRDKLIHKIKTNKRSVKISIVALSIITTIGLYTTWK